VNDKANTLYYRESDTGLLIVSEPIDQDHNWIAVPENHALVALSGERVRVEPLLHRHQLAAE
jgi:predicted glutamine amidotransferase